jgi:hypothetical protein
MLVTASTPTGPGLTVLIRIEDAVWDMTTEISAPDDCAIDVKAKFALEKAIVKLKV